MGLRWTHYIGELWKTDVLMGFVLVMIVNTLRYAKNRNGLADLLPALFGVIIFMNTLQEFRVAEHLIRYLMSGTIKN